MAAAGFYVLPGAGAPQPDLDFTPSSANTSPANSGLGSFIRPPKTHDTSRIGWHMKDLECLSNYIETVSQFAVECIRYELRSIRLRAHHFPIMADPDTVPSMWL
jgi:hypothetical protein